MKLTWYITELNPIWLFSSLQVWQDNKAFNLILHRGEEGGRNRDCGATLGLGGGGHKTHFFINYL